MKTCFKCGLPKDRSEFYKHPQMADGLLGKCKECAKTDVSANYHAKRGVKAAYERMRQATPHRRELQSLYAARRLERNPEKAIAWRSVSNAIRDGRLAKKPCESCGTTHRVQAHHDDYSRPLDVRWLCFRHHLEHHGKSPTDPF